MPVNWKAHNAFERLLAAMVAAQDMKLDYRRIATYYGNGATYDSIEGRFRIIKREANELKAEIESGSRVEAPARNGNAPANSVSTASFSSAAGAGSEATPPKRKSRSRAGNKVSASAPVTPKQSRSGNAAASLSSSAVANATAGVNGTASAGKERTIGGRVGKNSNGNGVAPTPTRERTGGRKVKAEVIEIDSDADAEGDEDVDIEAGLTMAQLSTAVDDDISGMNANLLAQENFYGSVTGNVAYHGEWDDAAGSMGGTNGQGHGHGVDAMPMSMQMQMQMQDVYDPFQHGV